MQARLVALVALIGGASASANFAQAPSLLSVLVVRVNSSSTTAWMDELSPAGQLPPLQTVAIAGCTVATGANQAYGSTSPDGQVGWGPGPGGGRAATPRMHGSSHRESRAL